MVPIVDQWCPSSRYGIKCPYKRTPMFIVVHNTANDAPAKNEVTYMINNSNEVSFHVAIDDVEIRRAIPFDRNAWASGDGTGQGNMNGIHIEICYSLSGGDRFTKAENNAAEYIAYLLHSYNWPLSKVTKHQDYDKKYCPHRTLNLGWNRFLKMVETYLKQYQKKEEPTVTYEEWVKYYFRYMKELEEKSRANTWAKESWDKATEKGVFNGKNPGGPLKREEAAIVLDRLKLLDK